MGYAVKLQKGGGKLKTEIFPRVNIGKSSTYNCPYPILDGLIVTMCYGAFSDIQTYMLSQVILQTQLQGKEVVASGYFGGYTSYSYNTTTHLITISNTWPYWPMNIYIVRFN